jgi:hypothetical protein
MSIDKIEAVRHGFRWHRGIRITRCSQISRFSYTVEIDVSKHYALSGRMVSGWPIKAHRHRGKSSTIPLIKCSLLMSASASRRLARAIDSRRPKDKPARLCTVWAGLRTAGWELSDLLRSGQSTRGRYKTNMIGTCTHHLYVAHSRRLGNRVLFCSRTNDFQPDGARLDFRSNTATSVA